MIRRNDVTYRTVRIVQFVNVLLFALVMGVFWGTWFSLSRSIASIRPETFLEIGHTMIANLGGPMSVPIDYQINQWTANTLPSDWTATRDKWELYHAIRTFVSLGALGFAVASALRWTPSPGQVV
jgi:hypothetical protein